MALLLPGADGIAEYVARHVQRAEVIAYGESDPRRLQNVTFYCLPYMGDAASIALIGQLPSLEVIQSLSSGVDEVLAAVPGRATLCNGQGLGHEEGTAELAVTMILASLRRIPRFAALQARRSWEHARTQSLDNKRVLLLGYGAIGMAIERRLLPFGVRVSKVSRTAREGVAGLNELPVLARDADILVVCIALHTSTKGIVNGPTLAALPDGALVVNVARGPVVDSDALARELGSGRLLAALDVTDPEPLPPDRPEWTMDNVLITPHIGGDTTTFVDRAPEFVAAQAVRHLAGEPLRNVVRHRESAIAPDW